MTEVNDDVKTQRRMVRCPEGHIFDAGARDACPICGARAPAAAAAAATVHETIAVAAEASSPRPSKRVLFIIGGAAALAIFFIIAIILRGTPTPLGDNGSPAAIAVDTPSAVAPRKPGKKDAVKAAKDIAGEWELVVPMPQGGAARWTIDFDPDGRYVFTDTSNGASHSGTYQAANGEWSLSGKWTRNPFLASGTVYADGGTYRLPAPDSLELQGRAGTGFWSRVH